MLYPYRETIMSELYPGSQHSMPCLMPAVTTFETCLALPVRYRHKVIWRMDSGFGSDKNIDFLLARGYQVLVKGASHRRAASLAQQVKRWQTVGHQRWIGFAPTPEAFSRPVKTLVLRYQRFTGLHHAYLYSTLPYAAKQTLTLYNQRGGAETEFRADKSGGGHLHKRRKHKRDAQQAWVLLTDMAHNYLAWFARHILVDSPFADHGPLRITRDLMRVPGLIEFNQGRLLSVKFQQSVPQVAELATCLARFWE